MKTRYLIPVVFCALWLCGASFAADDLPMYTGAAVIAQDAYDGITNYSYTLPKDAKREDVLAFYQDKLKLGEWTTSTSVDGPWLYLRSFAKDGRAFGLAVYGDKLLLLDAANPSDRTITDWVRNTVLLASPPLARVGSDEIPFTEYYSQLERLPYQDPSSEVSVESGLLVTKRLVTEALLLKMAQDQGVAPTDEQIAERFARATKSQDYLAIMRQTGLTEAVLKDRLRVEQAAFNLQTKGVTVTPEDIANEYKKQIAVFSIPKTVFLAGIFVKSKEDADKAMALLKDGAVFGTVARTMSVHESARNDGMLSPIPRNVEGIPESVKKIIFSTPVGKYTRPLDTGDGQWVIFKPIQYVPARVQKLDEVESMMHERLMLKKGMKQNPNVNADLAKVREASDIQVSIKRYENEVLHPPAKPAGE